MILRFIRNLLAAPSPDPIKVTQADIDRARAVQASTPAPPAALVAATYCARCPFHPMSRKGQP